MYTFYLPYYYKDDIRVDIHRLKDDEILGKNKRTYEKNNYTPLIGRIIFNLVCDWLIPISSDALIGPRSHSCVISGYRFKWWNLSVYNQTTVKVIFSFHRHFSYQFLNTDNTHTSQISTLSEPNKTFNFTLWREGIVKIGIYFTLSQGAWWIGPRYIFCNIRVGGPKTVLVRTDPNL